MRFFHRKLLPLCVATLLSGHAGAVGLGDIRLQSHLGRPLQALIPLTHVGDLDVGQIRVAIASAEEYERLGVEYDYQHSQLRLQPEVDEGGGFVRLVSPQPMVEPYLNFVVTLRWPNGQLSREYTVLLDPPPSLSAPVAGATAAGTPVVGTQTSRPDAPQRQSPGRAVAASGAASATPQRTSDGRYLTSRGDSLWRLAERLRPAGVPVAQMMNALHAANPDAFIGGDPGKLREAVPITVPGTGEIAEAGTVAPSAARAEPAPQPQDRFANRAAEPAPESPPTPVPDQGGRLELVAPVDTEQLIVENSALKTEVGRLSGSVGELTEQLARSEARLQQLETQLQAVLTRYDAQRGAPAVTPPTAGSPFADGAAPPSVGGMVGGEKGAMSEPAPTPPAQTPWWLHLGYWIAIGALAGWALYQQGRGRQRALPARPEEAVTPIVATPRVSPAAAPSSVRVVPRAEPAPAPESVPVAAEPVIGASHNAQEENEQYWRHHRAADEELPLDLVDGLPAAPAGSFAAASQATGADEGVDASISAGVFLAFGRYQEAEQVLVEALQREPGRNDLKLQLLDVYLQADNRGAFEALAQELETHCGDQPDVAAELAVLRNSYATR